MSGPTPTPEGLPPTLPGTPIVILDRAPMSTDGGRLPDGRIEVNVDDKVMLVGSPATLAALSAHLLCMVIDTLADEQ